MVMKLLRWGIALALIGWLGSVAVSAAARYLELSDVIERVVVEARPAGGIPDTGKAAYLRHVHTHIIGRASRPEAPLATDSVSVTASPGTVWVTVRWSHPVLTWNGRMLWAVPLSLTRTFANTL